MTKDKFTSEVVDTLGAIYERGFEAGKKETATWIPVSEKLPEDHDWYVIVVKEKSTGYQYIPRIASHNYDNCWSIIDTEDANKEWLDDLECIAWMPLPAPYNPQESEDEE